MRGLRRSTRQPGLWEIDLVILSENEEGWLATEEGLSDLRVPWSVEMRRDPDNQGRGTFFVTLSWLRSNDLI